MSTLEAKVVWHDGLRFSGTGGRSKFTLELDSPGEGAEYEGASPMEAVLIALGGCTGMDVISILGKMRQDVTDYVVHVRGERAPDHPRVYTDIVVEHVVTGRGLNRENVEKAVRLSETKYCSVSNMLARAANVRFEVRIIEHAPASAASRPGVTLSNGAGHELSAR